LIVGSLAAIGVEHSQSPQHIRPSSHPSQKLVVGKDGDWILGHTNPINVLARGVAAWGQPKLLSAMTDSGSHDQKPITSTVQKLVTIWLYYTPEAPPPSEPLTPTSGEYTKRSVKKEKSIKVEKVKP
jgi:hypothetical protein